MDRPVDHTFTLALPKAELHAHLSGSISTSTLHSIWLSKLSNNECTELEDPHTAIQPGGEFVDIVSFFPLFDKYIYQLVNDVPSVQYATQQIIEDFRKDGVAYLELRTTPRANVETGMTAMEYVSAVMEVVGRVNASDSGIAVFVILSIDRKMTIEQANGVVDLALRCQYERGSALAGSLNWIVGIDLCGNPSKGDVSIFTPAFQRAKKHGLRTTIHFAEISKSSIDSELETLLSWEPDRLGHVIHVPKRDKEVIQERRLGLELCLSCNVLAKLTSGGFALHHFGEWYLTECPIAISTDDVGVFGSPLSNEYLLAAQHFGLNRPQLIDLSKRALAMAFGNTDIFMGRIVAFQRVHAAGNSIGMENFPSNAHKS